MNAEFLYGLQSGFDAFFLEGATAVSLPVVSACQTQRREANARNSKGTFIPRCAPDGQYEPVQCHARTGDCWCVDKSGRELFGSRRMAEKLNCSSSSSFSGKQFSFCLLAVWFTTYVVKLLCEVCLLYKDYVYPFHAVVYFALRYSYVGAIALLLALAYS